MCQRHFRLPRLGRTEDASPSLPVDPALMSWNANGNISQRCKTFAEHSQTFNATLISCDTNVQRNTDMALKQEYITGLQNSVSLLCVWHVLAQLHTWKTLRRRFRRVKYSVFARIY